MPRRREVPKRPVTPDPVYHSALVTSFVHAIMRCGKKTKAQGLFYGAMDLIRDKTQDDPLKVFKKAVDNVKPKLEVKSRRVGGSTYQVPIDVSPRRQTSLALRWLISYAANRGEKTFRDRLANEFMDAAENRGAAAKKKEDTHRMAEANRAFAHYRW